MDWNRLPKYSKKKERKFEEDIEKENLSRKDRFAMILAAYIVFLPAALLAIGFLVLCMFLIIH